MLFVVIKFALLGCIRTIALLGCIRTSIEDSIQSWKFYPISPHLYFHPYKL